jgi:pilus assembly protein CpaC
MVPINGTVRWHMAARGKTPDGKEDYPLIGTAQFDKEGIIQVRPDPLDQRFVLIRGIVPGITLLRLTAVNEREPEVYEVIVQQDIELLRNILRRAVPTASVNPIPGAGNTIILTGWVAHSEDVDTIMRISRTFTSGAAGGADIINALKVGGVMQVQLDVVVARVARSEFRRMANDLYQLGDQHQFTSATGGAINVPQNLTGGTAGQPFQVTNTIGSPNGAAINSFLAIFTQRQTFFIFLQALRDNNLAKLLAEPRLMTLSGHAAQFNSGGQQAVPQVSGLGGTAGIQFVDFGTRLNFLPIVLGNGKIYLEVEPEVSSLDQASGVILAGSPIPGRLLQRIHTSVEMEPGQTLAIGGLIQNTVQASTSKIPCLGDLPFVGTLFSRKSYNEVEEELVVLVTPHLVDPLDCQQLPKFLPGQETRRADDFELFLEGILEAPRGQREVCPDRHYVPAYKHSPTVQKYPCGANNGTWSCGGPNGCGLKGKNGCGNGCSNGCGNGCDSQPQAPKPLPAPNAPASVTMMYPDSVPMMMDQGSQVVMPASGPPPGMTADPMYMMPPAGGMAVGR